MDAKKILILLRLKYPGKNIIKNDESNPTEILCEVDPTQDHPDHSNAVAIIDKSKPHVHHRTTETYKVTKGKLVLHVGDQSKELNEGDTYTIKPGNVHWAEGNETWVECYSEPGWVFEDHILQ